MNKVLKVFLSNYTSLSKLRKNIQSTYDGVKGALETSKEFGIPLKSNPLVRIQNQLIELEYLTNQYIWNYEVYLDLINQEVIIDSNLIQQIQGLIHIQKELFKEFIFLQERLNKVQVSHIQESKIA